MNDNIKTPVTVLGLGPMGQALAGAFHTAGHQTTVWNRTPGKADDLVARGAVRADTVAEAVAASPVVIVCVIDYTAARAIMEPVAAALRGRTLVNLTADTPERARDTAAWAAEHDINYLDGAIMTPTDTIGGPGAVLLYSGSEAVYRASQPALTSLGGRQTYLGADSGRAAAHDVALLDIFWTSVSGLAHSFALAAAEGIAPSDLAPFAHGIAELMPIMIDEFAAAMEKGEHPGDAANIRSAAAGMAHIEEASRAQGIDSSLIAAAHGMARRAIDAGHGDNAISRLIDHLRESAGVSGASR